MDSASHMEAVQHEASRVAHHMRRLAGFAPTTDARSGAEFQLYAQVVHRVRGWMYAQGITPDTVRGNLHALSEQARAEGQQLYDYVSQGALRSEGLAWVLSSPAACQAYVLAIMLSIQGSLSAEDELRERGRPHRPQWQTRGHPARTTRHVEDERRGGERGGGFSSGGRRRGSRRGPAMSAPHPQSAAHTVSVDASDL